ncbi:MAG: sodium-dependent transporter [Bacteroidales bacterium]|nr:sodium-dependent transporter [Bacteroidales bacterium]
MSEHKRENFSSKLGIIVATAGSALGLGNIYRFPCEAGANGGGAFLIVYLCLALLIGTPLMISEFVIGRRSRSNPVGAFRRLAGKKNAWPVVGYMGVLCAFLILAFYTTVAGWTLGYLAKSVLNHFAGQDLPQIQQQFVDFTNHQWWPIVCQLVFLALTALVVARGVKDGIEKWSKVLMPLLLVIMFVLCVKSLTLSGAGEGLRFFFNPDFSKINGRVLISALGQSFFSLSIGMGALITYGSYIGKNDNMASSALGVVLADTLVAVLAGIVIFPAAFTFGIQPEAGASLAFTTLPMVFQQMSGGYVFCLMFFLLLVIATLTSTISLLEVIVAAFTEELQLSRPKSAWIGAAATAVIGVLATLSFRTGSPLHIGSSTVFDLLDHVTALYIMPIGGLLIVIFVGWRMKKADVMDELTNNGKLRAGIRNAIRLIIRYLAPVAIAVIFISQLIGK